MKKTATVWLVAALLGVAGLLLGVALLTFFPLKAAREGDTVHVNYTLRLEDGTVYDSSNGRDPLEFTLGRGTVIPGLEEAVKGMRTGETKTVRIPPEKAYGAYRPELVHVVSKSQLPEGMQPVVGQLLGSHSEDGTPSVVVITEFTEASVTLDANPVLAGQNLTFEIQLMRIGSGPAPRGVDKLRLHRPEPITAADRDR